VSKVRLSRARVETLSFCVLIGALRSANDPPVVEGNGFSTFSLIGPE